MAWQNIIWCCVNRVPWHFNKSKQFLFAMFDHNFIWSLIMSSESLPWTMYFFCKLCYGWTIWARITKIETSMKMMSVSNPLFNLGGSQHVFCPWDFYNELCKALITWTLFIVSVIWMQVFIVFVTGWNTESFGFEGTTVKNHIR